MTRLEEEDLVAGVERVDQRGFPRARARRRVDDDLVGSAEDVAHACEHVGEELLELRTAVVDRGIGDRTQHESGTLLGRGLCRENAVPL